MILCKPLIRGDTSSIKRASTSPTFHEKHSGKWELARRSTVRYSLVTSRASVAASDTPFMGRMIGAASTWDHPGMVLRWSGSLNLPLGAGEKEEFRSRS